MGLVVGEWTVEATGVEGKRANGDLSVLSDVML